MHFEGDLASLEGFPSLRINKGEYEQIYWTI
jgi:hypothetical protein